MKQKFTKILCGLVFIYSSAFTQIPTNGLVAYYPFNGNANDESGNGYNGKPKSVSLTNDRFGKVNSAYSFDGFNDYINLKNLGPVYRSNLNSYSISLWVLFKTTSSDQELLSLGYWGDDFATNVHEIEFENSRFQVETETGNNAVNHEFGFDPVNPTTNEWIHIVLVFNGNSFNYYRNGTLISTNNYIPAETTCDSLYLGCFAGTSNYNQEYFFGNMDDIRIYNVILNEQEIHDLFKEGEVPTISFEDQNATVGRIIEIPVKTKELASIDNVIAYQFDFNYDNTRLEYISNSITETLSEGGIFQINYTTGKLSIAWASGSPIVGEGSIVNFQFKVIDAGEITPTLTNALYNTDTVNVSNGTITAEYKYGDIDANEYVQAYDAAVAIQYSVDLDPLPGTDPLPWESWRIVTANVDGAGGVTANDASEILKYIVGIITHFPVETKSMVTAKNADINFSVENGEIILTSSGELFGLNIFVNENYEILGEPQLLVNNALFVKNINENKYALGLATAYSPSNNTSVIKIPFTITQNEDVTFDMIINTSVKSVTVSLPTGIVKIKEQAVTVYPNPTNSILYFNGIHDATVSVFDFCGRLLLKQLNTTTQIDVTQLQNGCYMVKIENENGTFIQKFIKN